MSLVKPTLGNTPKYFYTMKYLIQAALVICSGMTICLPKNGSKTQLSQFGKALFSLE